MSLRALHKQMQECIGALRGEMGQIRDGSGELGRRYAGGGDDGAAISHHDALRRSAGLPGVEGGTAPRQPLPGTREAWPQRVGWLMTANGS